MHLRAVCFLRPTGRIDREGGRERGREIRIESNEPMMHLRAVCFLRPTGGSIDGGGGREGGRDSVFQPGRAPRADDAPAGRLLPPSHR